jgi:hypothetical protein
VVLKRCRSGENRTGEKPFEEYVAEWKEKKVKYVAEKKVKYVAEKKVKPLENFIFLYQVYV